MITPSDTPSSPADYAGVTPHGQGTAPYDIQAAQQDLSAEFGEANAVAGAGFLYPQGPRQAMTEVLMQSSQGFALDGYDIDAGFHGGQGGDAGWPNNVEPGG
jgi:hypothetical protein